MALKKILGMAERQAGQAALEYFILLSIIVLLTLISLSSFLPKVRSAGESLSQRIAGRMNQ